MNEIEANRYLYVCEGKTDTDKLKKLGCFFIIETGGIYIKKEIITFLKIAHEVREIVLVLDPDSPGIQIRNKIKEVIGKCHICYINQNKAKKGKKVGIAQTKMEDLKMVLSPYIKHDIFSDESFSIDDDYLFDYKIKINKKYGESNTLFKRLMYKVISHYLLPLNNRRINLDKITDYLNIINVNINDLDNFLNEEEVNLNG